MYLSPLTLDELQLKQPTKVSDIKLLLKRISDMTSFELKLEKIRSDGNIYSPKKWCVTWKNLPNGVIDVTLGQTLEQIATGDIVRFYKQLLTWLLKQDIEALELENYINRRKS